MAFARQYSLQEVQGMLQIYRNNHAIHGVDANHQITRANAGAHADIHAGASFLDLQARVNTPGQPRLTGTYWSTEDQAAATLEVLNSAAGQLELAKLDDPLLAIGDKRAAIRAPLTPGRYKVAQAQDRSNHPGQPGHLVNNSPLRANAGARQEVKMASQGFVLAVPGVGGLLQIQTSWPSQVV
jgi:hypothetical protein